MTAFKLLSTAVQSRTPLSYCHNIELTSPTETVDLLRIFLMVRRYPTREATLAEEEEEEAAGAAALVQPAGQQDLPPNVEQGDVPRAPVAPELVNVQERMLELFERATADQRLHLVRLLDDVNRGVEGTIEGVANLPFAGPQAQHFVRRAGM